ncbi:MAG: hypothetical protein HKO56_03945, partial [Bacteroidia bacterium]|nr:hypothetical protein [Bacteroidia bacterium]NNM15789.1 hypothetical protein [Bacteroidia bacterium]
NLIIALGATLLALESLVLVNAASVSTLSLLVVFFSSMCIYHLAEINFSFQIEPTFKLVLNNNEQSAFHQTMFIVSALFLLVSVFFLELSSVLFLMLLTIITFAYGIVKFKGVSFSFRALPIFKNIMLAGMWAMVTVVFPLLVEKTDLFTMAGVLVFVERFLFILVLSFMFDLRDYYTDPKEGIRTIAGILGFKKLKYVSQILLLLLAIISVFHFVWFYSGNNWIPLLLAIVLSLVITSFFIFITNKNKPKQHYSLLFDGATVIQAVLVLMLSLLAIN